MDTPAIVRNLPSQLEPLRYFLEFNVLVATVMLVTSFGLTPAIALNSTRAVSETQQNQLYQADRIGVNPITISQAVNQTVYVLIFSSDSEHEGIYTILFNGRNKVLMFESGEDAIGYALKLKQQNFPVPTVEPISAKEIIEFCQLNNYDYELIAKETELIPPTDHGRWSGKNGVICNAEECIPSDWIKK